MYLHFEVLFISDRSSTFLGGILLGYINFRCCLHFQGCLHCHPNKEWVYNSSKFPCSLFRSEKFLNYPPCKTFSVWNCENIENKLKIKVIRKSILVCKYFLNGGSDLYEILCGGQLLSCELKFKISWFDEWSRPTKCLHCEHRYAKLK